MTPEAEASINRARAKLSAGGYSDLPTPGSTPGTPLETEAPEVSTGTRFKLGYTSLGPEDIVQGLKKQGLEAVPDRDNVSVKSPSTGKWHHFRPDDYSWKRVGDAVGDIQDMIGMTIGGVAGSLVEGPAALVTGPLGAAAGAALSKGLRTGSWEGAKQGALEGATAELGGKAINWAGKKVVQGVKKAVPAVGEAAGKVSALLKRPQELQGLEDEARVLARDESLLKGPQEATKTAAANQAVDQAKMAAGEARIGQDVADLGASKAATAEGLVQEKARESFPKAEFQAAGTEVQRLKLKYAAATRARMANLPAAIARGEEIASTPLADAMGKVRVIGQKSSGANRKVLLDQLDPAYGTRSDVLEVLPELQQIGQDSFGQGFRNRQGSTAMSVADKGLRGLEDYHPRLENLWYPKTAKWMLGEEGAVWTAAKKKSLIAIAQGRGTDEDIKIFQAALQGRINRAVKAQPDLSAAMLREQEGRYGVKAAGSETAANKIAYGSDAEDQAAAARKISEAKQGIQPEKIRLADETVSKTERLAYEQAVREGLVKRGINLTKKETAISGPQRGMAKGMERLAGAAAGGLAGAPFGLAGPGAVVGGLASSAMAGPMAVAGRIIDWARRRSPQMAQSLIARAPRSVRGALQQVLTTLQTNGEAAARVLAQTLIKANPDLQQAIDNLIP